jgi:hypothetical protein
VHRVGRDTTQKAVLALAPGHATGVCVRVGVGQRGYEATPDIVKVAGVVKVQFVERAGLGCSGMYMGGFHGR